MMALPEELQNNFESKLTNYQESKKMPLLMNIEKRAIDRTAKQTSQKYICQILERRFKNLPESLVNQTNQIEDLNVLEQLVLETISVNSLAEFETLIEPHLANKD